jgi:hypothetical protein
VLVRCTLLLLASALLATALLGARPPVYEQGTYRATTADYIRVPDYKPVPCYRPVPHYMLVHNYKPVLTFCTNVAGNTELK